MSKKCKTLSTNVKDDRVFGPRISGSEASIRRLEEFYNRLDVKLMRGRPKQKIELSRILYYQKD